jgi:hypothetical protein
MSSIQYPSVSKPDHTMGFSCQRDAVGGHHHRVTVPARHASNVDFPLPDGPMIATISPARTFGL